jgi:Flp pilus assembly protein protease CpaA
MLPVGFSSWPLITNILIIIGVLCALTYFYFSQEHKGAFGASAKIGIWTLMVGFGAGFGLTVMGRVSLLAERVVFIRDYLNELFKYLS